MKLCHLLAVALIVQTIMPVSSQQRRLRRPPTMVGKSSCPYGTWKFKEPAASLERKGENIKPLSATEVIKSRRGFFELWYNPEKWSTQSGIKHDIAEFSLKHASGDAYAMVIVERIPTSEASLRKIALENAKSSAPDAKIVLDEERTVNSVKMRVMQIEGTIQSIPFKYYGYYWTGKAGTLQLITFTSQNLFDEVVGDFTELLDGAVITKE